jgi:hypothetical protein
VRKSKMFYNIFIWPFKALVFAFGAALGSI